MLRTSSPGPSGQQGFFTGLTSLSWLCCTDWSGTCHGWYQEPYLWMTWIDAESSIILLIFWHEFRSHYFWGSTDILPKKSDAPLNRTFKYLYKLYHIYISIALQTDNIHHIISTSLKDLLSIDIVKWFLDMLSTRS